MVQGRVEAGAAVSGGSRIAAGPTTAATATASPAAGTGAGDTAPGRAALAAAMAAARACSPAESSQASAVPNQSSRAAAARQAATGREGTLGIDMAAASIKLAILLLPWQRRLPGSLDGCAAGGQRARLRAAVSTSCAWLGTFTLRQLLARRPALSIKNVERSMPM